MVHRLARIPQYVRRGGEVYLQIAEGFAGATSVTREV
jgi:hypothetical protein